MVACLSLSLATFLLAQDTPPSVIVRRVADGGIQPQAVTQDGKLHVIFFKGDPRHGDLYYVFSTDDAKTFSKPLRINSHPGSAIAVGNIRGAHLAVGAGGRVHVSWMGSSKAEPRAPGKASPMLYARLNDAGDAFEPERNLIGDAVGLDGGGSIAAEGDNVFVAWHAPPPGKKGEAERRVWLTASTDGGKTFEKERAISPPETGVCGCCGMRAFVNSTGQLGVLYRSASEEIHRDMYLLLGSKGGFAATKLQEWEVRTCPMTSAAFARGGRADLLAWETDGQVFFSIKSLTARPNAPIGAPGPAAKRKHPTIAANGEATLFAWTEGMAWSKGGGLRWQLFAADGRPLSGAGASGTAPGVPVWSLITAAPLKGGSFVILY